MYVWVKKVLGYFIRKLSLTRGLKILPCSASSSIWCTKHWNNLCNPSDKEHILLFNYGAQVFIACYCWTDLQRATGCTHLMHKPILQNLLQGQVFTVCWQISENVLWTKPWSELPAGLDGSQVVLCCSPLSQGHHQLAARGVSSTAHPPHHHPSKHTATTAPSLATISNCTRPIMDASPLTVDWNYSHLSSTFSFSSTGNITHPGAYLNLEDLYLWVILTCASLTQFPLGIGSSLISIKLIIDIRWMIPQKTRFLSLQPQ